MMQPLTTSTGVPQPMQFNWNVSLILNLALIDDAFQNKTDVAE